MFKGCIVFKQESRSRWVVEEEERGMEVQEDDKFKQTMLIQRGDAKFSTRCLLDSFKNFVVCFPLCASFAFSVLVQL